MVSSKNVKFTITGIPEGHKDGEEKNGAEAIFEKIISKHFSKSVKNNNTNSRVLLNPKQDKYKQQNKANKQKTKQKTDLDVSNC